MRRPFPMEEWGTPSAWTEESRTRWRRARKLAADAALMVADVGLVAHRQLPRAALAAAGEDLAAALRLHPGAEPVLVLAPAVPALPLVTHVVLAARSAQE